MKIKEKLQKPMVANFFFLVLLQGVNYLLPLISIPFLYRTLGVDKWGLTAFGYAFIQYFVMLTDFGFNLSGTKYVSQNKTNPAVINRYLNSAMIVRFMLSLVSFLILFVLILIVNKFRLDPKFYVLYFGIVIGNVMFPMWFFQGMEKMKYMTLFNILSKGLSLIPFFIFIRKPEHYMLVPIFYSFGFILAGAVSLYLIYYKMNMKWFLPRMKEIIFALKDSSTYFLSRVSTSLFTTSNTFIIGLVLGDTPVGYYSAAEKLYQAYNQLLTPLTGVLFPHIAQSKNVAFFRKIYRRISYTNILCVAIALICSSFILLIVYGEVDPQTLPTFRILLAGCLVTIPSMLLGYPFLAAMGHPQFTNLTLVFISFVHVTGLLILIIFGIFNIVNVAIMVVFSEVLLFIIRRQGVTKFNLFK